MFCLFHFKSLKIATNNFPKNFCFYLKLVLCMNSYMYKKRNKWKYENLGCKCGWYLYAIGIKFHTNETIQRDRIQIVRNN